jgi:hypothetical protein
MRKALTLLTVLVLLLTASLSLAQDDLEYCGSLSEEDCALLNSAAPSLPDSTAFEATFVMDVTAPEEEAFAFTMSAAGGYVMDPAELEDALEAVADLSILEFNLDNALDIADATINSFDGELLITINPPADAAPPMFQSIPLNLWLVDGVGYVDLSPVAMFDPSFDGVFGMDIIDTVRFGLSEVTIGDLLEAGEDMTFDFEDFGELNAEDFNFGQQQVQLTDEEGIAFLEETMTLERLEDTEIGGSPVAVFEFAFDVPALFSSQPFMEGFEMNAPEEAGMTAEEFSEVMVEAVGEDSTFVINYYVGLEDNFTYGIDLSMNLDLDIAVLEAAFDEGMMDDMDASEEDTDGETMDEEMMSPVLDFNFAFTFTRSNINGLESIELPENAVVVTIEELLEQMMGTVEPQSDA